MNITLKGPFPCIIGGLNKGLTDYLKYQEKPWIWVIFILNPNFKVKKKRPNTYFTSIFTHPNNAKAVMQEMEGCIYPSEDQEGCDNPQKLLRFKILISFLNFNLTQHLWACCFIFLWSILLLLFHLMFYLVDCLFLTMNSLPWTSIMFYSFDSI